VTDLESTRQAIWTGIGWTGGSVARFGTLVRPWEAASSPRLGPSSTNESTMYRTGHYGAALLAYAPIVAVLLATGFRTLALLGAPVAVALATLPDYDLRVPFLDHRGLTHTVWFAIAVGVTGGLVAGLAGNSQGPVAAIGLGIFGFVVGTVSIGSHVAADALTPAGVRPFAPLRSRHYSYSVTTAKNPIANYALLGLGLIAIAGAFVLGNRIAAGLP
jgi:inner membrane protein